MSLTHNLDVGPYRIPFSRKGVPGMPHFVAREEEMNHLKQALLRRPTRPDGRRVFVLHGVGGSGKTQLAANFARETQTIFGSTHWINAESRQSVRESIASVARRIPEGQIPTECRKGFASSTAELDMIIGSVLDWFALRENNGWLLVFDNVDRDDSPEANDPLSFDVEEFFPEHDHGSILITTRLHQLKQLGGDRQLNRMNDEQGVELLRQRIRRPVEGDEPNQISYSAS